METVSEPRLLDVEIPRAECPYRRGERAAWFAGQRCALDGGGAESNPWEGRDGRAGELGQAWGEGFGFGAQVLAAVGVTPERRA